MNTGSAKAFTEREKAIHHIEYVDFCFVCETTFCFTIRLLNKGILIDVLGQYLILRHVE